jgi:hypothetical protein
LPSNHGCDDQHKATTPDPSEITGGEVKKAIVLGATQGVARKAGGGVITLILWCLRNIL